MCVLVILMVWFQVTPTWGVLVLPLLILLMVLTATGLGAWLTALAIQYRDVKHAMSFVMQLLMYAAPVVYPTSLVPERWQFLYALNPMAEFANGLPATYFQGLKLLVLHNKANFLSVM